jgi:hypothetical protein
MKTNKIYPFLIPCLAMVLLLSSCTKSKLDDDFTIGDPPAIAGGFVNSSEVGSADLVAYFPFDGSIEDSKGAVTGGQPNGTISFAEGRKGQAYQGSMNGFLSYDNPGPIATLTSFTTAFWINTEKHDGGAQGLFALSKEDGSFWGNFFVIIEGNGSTSNKMQPKLHFEKNGAPFVEHWVDPAESWRPDDMYGAWRHLVYTYDEATSLVQWYVSGNKVNVPDDATKRQASDGVPLGALSFKNPAKFVIGGFQNHLGEPYNGLETWMLNYTGKLDEFKIFNRALTAQEVLALYKLERQGR